MFALLLPDNHAHYDSLQGLYGWAKDSLTLHSADPRAHLYSLAQLEAGNTHDDLWNAAQLQVVRDGKMHVSRPTSAPLCTERTLTTNTIRAHPAGIPAHVLGQEDTGEHRPAMSHCHMQHLRSTTLQPLSAGVTMHA